MAVRSRWGTGRQCSRLGKPSSHSQCHRVDRFLWGGCWRPGPCQWQRPHAARHPESRQPVLRSRHVWRRADFWSTWRVGRNRRAARASDADRRNRRANFAGRGQLCLQHQITTPSSITATAGRWNWRRSPPSIPACSAPDGLVVGPTLLSIIQTGSGVLDIGGFTDVPAGATAPRRRQAR